MHSVIPASFVSSVPRRNLSSERERNIVAAIFSAKVIVLLIMALAIPNWYYLKGGGCSRRILGNEFFYISSYETLSVPTDNGNRSYSTLAYYGLSEGLENCLTPTIVTVQRIIIGLCFATIFFSFCQFFFDIAGVKNSSLKCTRKCGLGSILSVITIVVIIGMCYYTSDLMEQQQKMTKLYPTTRVEVTFGISYYLIAAAGVVSVLATASNLFRCDHLFGNVDASLLLDDHQEEETFSIALPHSQSWAHIHEHHEPYISNLPPPPPYTP